MVRSALNQQLKSDQPVEWAISEGLTDYRAAEMAMEARVAAIREGKARELVWLLEHPPVLTGGTSAQEADLRDGVRFPVHKTARGGEFTYHGPGQRVAYFMLDLTTRARDVRAFVASLEEMIITALAAFNVVGERREDRVGVWVRREMNHIREEDKIAAIGIRLRHWISFHGIALNVEPDLTHFDAIVPCGIADSRFGVTSLVDLGLPVTMAEVDDALRSSFEETFGPTEMAPAPKTDTIGR